MKRRLLLTSALQKKLCRLLRAGVPTKTASEACGISDRTVRSWLSQAEEVGADSTLVAFTAAVTCAKAKARVTFVSRIIEASKTDWRACAYLLARLEPSEFGVRSTEETNFAPSNISITHSYVPSSNGE